jgi:hypothetical protein
MTGNENTTDAFSSALFAQSGAGGFDALKHNIASTDDAMVGLRDRFEHSFERMESALVHFTRSGKFEWQDFAHVALNALQDVTRSWLGIDSLKAAPAGGGSFGRLGDLLGSLFGSADSSLPPDMLAARAEGGWLGRRELALVGERGPEIFVPDVAGTVLPDQVLQGLAGGEGAAPLVFHQHLHLSVGVPEAVRREVVAMMPNIARAAREAVSADFDRYGALRRRLS